jgi:transcriptional regulator with XRE-family HTH domain
LLDEASLHEWMGVSKAFPSDNRMSEDERGSDEIGPTPSLKTLWQIATATGCHPVLFLADENLREAIRDLAESEQDQQVVDKATHTLDRAEKAWERFEKAQDRGQRIDNRDHWLDLIEDYAREIGCGSPGGILGARLGIEAEDPSTLAAMTRFGHLLDEVACEGLFSIDLFSTPTREGPFSYQEEN